MHGLLTSCANLQQHRGSESSQDNVPPVHDVRRVLQTVLSVDESLQQQYCDNATVGDTVGDVVVGDCVVVGDAVVVVGEPVVGDVVVGEAVVTVGDTVVVGVPVVGVPVGDSVVG